MRVLKMRSIVAGHRELTKTHWEQSLTLILLQLSKKLWRTQHQPFYCHLVFEANWKGEKTQVRSLWANQKFFLKIVLLKCHLLFYITKTVSQLDCYVQQEVDFIWQPTMASSVVGLRRSSKALPKAKLAPKNGHGHWQPAAHLIHYSFLNSSETITS